MKKTVFLLSIILIAFYSNAQDSYQNDQVQTIFSKSRSNGGDGAFSIGYTNINGKDALISGARGMFIFDHMLGIGFGGYGFVNNFNNHYHYPDPNNELSLAGGYGGLILEPIVAGRSPVHVAFPILIGMGGISLVDLYNWDYWPGNPWYNYNYDVFFVFEPSVELEFNFARFFRTALFASYRITSKIDMYQTDDDVLNGFNFGATFKFGKF